MTTSTFPELTELRSSIAPDVVASHIETITAALGAAEPVVASALPWARWRRWLAGLLVGVGVLVPGAAFASDSALPGDLLYPVKKLLEPLVELVDHDVVAQHRIEELEDLVDRGDPADASTVDSLIDEAVDALDRLDSPSLEARLDAVRRIDLGPVDDVGDRPERDRDRAETPTPVDRGDSDRDRIETPTPDEPPDRTPTPTADEPSPSPTDRVEPVIPDVEPTPTSPATDAEPTPTPPARDQRPTPTPTTQPRREEPTPTTTPTDGNGDRDGDGDD